MLQALRTWDFRVFLAGQAMSLFGNQVQQVGLLWLVYQTGHSATLLGTTMFLMGVPSALIAPWVGVWADRGRPLRLAMATQALSGVQALAVWGLVLTGDVHLLPLLLLVCAQGILIGVDMPLRQILVPRLLTGQRSLGSGVALNSLVYDGTRIAGASLGGWIASAWGESSTFLVNGLAHLLTAALFLTIRRPPARPQGNGRPVELLREGWRYAVAFWPVRAILLMSAVVSFAGSAYMILLPMIVGEVLGGDATGLGMLMGAAGMGALLGGLAFGVVVRQAVHPWLIGLGAGMFGTGLAILSASSSLALALAAMLVLGFGIMIMMVACSTTLIGLAAADKQGRVLSLFTLSYAAAAPLGGLCAGWLSSRIGAPLTIAGSAALSLTAALRFLSVLDHLRPFLEHDAAADH